MSSNAKIEECVGGEILINKLSQYNLEVEIASMVVIMTNFIHKR